jgi:hypothetical protein
VCSESHVNPAVVCPISPDLHHRCCLLMLQLHPPFADLMEARRLSDRAPYFFALHAPMVDIFAIEPPIAARRTRATDWP